MGLINLYTDLKSLKFGKDRIGGGSSNQPYIKTPIPEKIGEFGYLNQDFILRGGSKALTDSAFDVVRLGKYFTDLRNPSGLLFTLKQNLLSRMAVRTQSSTGILNEGIYTPLSTLLQAGGSAFGLHVNKQGLNPFNGAGGITKYEDAVKLTNTETTEASTITSTTTVSNGNGGQSIASTTSSPSLRNRLVGLWNDKIIISNTSVNVLSYKGGPGSILGIGSTNIKFADQRTGLNNPNYGKDNKFQAGSRYNNINYNHTLGLSVSSSFSSLLESPTQTGINEFGQVIRDSNYQIEKNNIVINYKNALGLSVSSSFSSSLKSPDQTGINKLGQLIRNPDNYFYDGYLKSDEIKDDILFPRSFNPASYLYPGLVDNKLVLSSAVSSKEGGGSNWFYAIGGGGLILVNPGIGGQLSGYTNKPLSQAGPIGTITGQNTGDNATYTKDDLVNDEYTRTYRYTQKVKDFRKILRSRIIDSEITEYGGSNPHNILSSAPDYETKNIEKRVKLGDPGYRNGKNLKSYANGSNPGKIVGYSGGNASITSYDKINALPIYLGSTADEENGNDLVKFRIGVIDNDQPSLKTYIHFRAFLNQISDAYSAEWNGTKYVGRGENLYTYGGFDRKVSLSWTVAAQSKAELIPMYKKLNYLASICAPDYSANGYMRGNIVTLTIGGYFYEQPGIITGFSYEMNDDNSTWEIGINDEGASDHTVKELPHSIKVNGFNFIPIHTFIPRKQVNNYNSKAKVNGDVLTDKNVYGKERYIALDQGNESYNNYGPIAKYPQPDPVPASNPNPAQAPNLVLVSSQNPAAGFPAANTNNPYNLPVNR